MKKKKIIVAVLSVSFLVGLVLLAFFVRQTPHSSVDLGITKFIQNLRSPVLDNVFEAASWPGYPPHVNYFVPILILFIGLLGWFREAFFLFVAALLVSGLGQVVKMWVDRPRPKLSEIAFIVHQGLEGGQRSFPAGHVQSYVAILGFLAIILYIKMKHIWLRRCLVGLCVLMIIFVGPSRVYLGEHWASDVVGAYLLGLFVLGITYLAYDKSSQKSSRNKI